MYTSTELATIFIEEWETIISMLINDYIYIYFFLIQISLKKVYMSSLLNSHFKTCEDGMNPRFAMQ